MVKYRHSALAKDKLDPNEHTEWFSKNPNLQTPLNEDSEPNSKTDFRKVETPANQLRNLNISAEIVASKPQSPHHLQPILKLGARTAKFGQTGATMNGPQNLRNKNQRSSLKVSGDQFAERDSMRGSIRDGISTKKPLGDGRDSIITQEMHKTQGLGKTPAETEELNESHLQVKFRKSVKGYTRSRNDQNSSMQVDSMQISVYSQKKGFS